MSNLKGHALPVRSISYSVAGDAIVSGSEDCTLKVSKKNKKKSKLFLLV